MPLWLNGNLVAEDGLHFRENDLAVSRGYGVFDYLLVQNGIPIFLQDHLDRFYHSAKGLHMHVPMDKLALKQIIQQLVAPFPQDYSDIKLLLTGGDAAYNQPITAPVLLVKTTAWKAAEPKPLRLMSFDYQRELACFKHTNYTMGVWLQPILAQKQYDDALYVSNGYVSELPRANIFVVTKHGVLVTPTNHVLPGITRKHVLELAEKIMPVEQRDLSLDELLDAEEVFVTSTTKAVLPVAAVDNKPIGANGGATTVKLQQLLAGYKTLHMAAFKW